MKLSQCQTGLTIALSTLLVSPVAANADKIIFTGPAPANIPLAKPSLSDLNLDVLGPEGWDIRTNLTRVFPAVRDARDSLEGDEDDELEAAEAESGPEGHSSWFLLDNLTEGQRYELRVCWAAIVSTTQGVPKNVQRNIQSLPTQPGTNALRPRRLRPRHRLRNARPHLLPRAILHRPPARSRVSVVANPQSAHAHLARRLGRRRAPGVGPAAAGARRSRLLHRRQGPHGEPAAGAGRPHPRPVLVQRGAALAAADDWVRGPCGRLLVYRLASCRAAVYKNWLV